MRTLLRDASELRLARVFYSFIERSGLALVTDDRSHDTIGARSSVRARK